MTLQQHLQKIVGQWHGTNLMRLTPDKEYGKSDAQATVSIVAQGNAVILTYTWAEAGKAQDGALLITNGPKPDSVAAVWVDSWHQYPQWMELSGSIDEHGVMHLEGAYTSEGKQCGWRIHIDCSDDRQLSITMDNIYGDVDYQAVEAKYSRAIE